MPKNSPLFVDVGEGMSVMVGRPTVAIWTSDTRPKDPKKGSFGFNSDTNNLELYSGYAWFFAPLVTAES